LHDGTAYAPTELVAKEVGLIKAQFFFEKVL
jgi:hypothetical protein